MQKVVFHNIIVNAVSDSVPDSFINIKALFSEQLVVVGKIPIIKYIKLGGRNLYQRTAVHFPLFRFQINLEKLSHIVQQSDVHVGVEGGLKKILFQIDMLSSETGYFLLV
ncbi:MAG: hypothetical protein PUE99_03990 [Anaerovibrio sp.]|nr:hypothetical protein [Anaerovibrio sp.]